MTTIRAFKKIIYERMSRFYWRYLVLLVSFLIGFVVFVLRCLSLNSEENIWTYICIATFFYAGVSVYLIVTGITLWGWHFVTFRYMAYWASWVFSLIRRIWKSGLFRIIFVLILSAVGWGVRQELYPGRENYEFLQDILMFSTLLKILAITLVLLVIWQMFRYRKKLVISDFGDFTGDKELEPVIQGISAMILNEMNRLSILLNTIDEIQPDNMLQEKQISALTMDVQDLGKELEEIIGPSSTINIAKVINIPLKPLYVFFRKKLRGPLLIGSIHMKGDKLIMSACLKGGKYNGSWQINAGDIDEPFETNSRLIIQMTNQLIFRIFAYIFREKSPRWETMKHYTRGLKIFRETVKTEENKKLNLIKAKNEFNLAIQKDNHFIQCYYNLGVIYSKLGNNNAATAAFSKAIEKQPGYCHCYYQLASIHYNLGDYNNAEWYCNEAINICPTNSQYWNLLGVIHYYRWDKKDWRDFNMKIHLHEVEALEKWFKEEKEIPNQAIYPIKIGAVQAWRSLCKAIVLGDKIQKHKKTAMKNIRNQAVLSGKMKIFKTKCLFWQSLILSQDENELHFQQGKYFFKNENWPKAHEAFQRVYENDQEMNDPFCFWAMYIHTNAKLLKALREEKNNCLKSQDYKKCKYSDKCEDHKNKIKNGYRLFLGAAAKLIHKGMENNDDTAQEKEKSLAEIKLYEKFVAQAFELTQIDSNNFNANLLQEEIKKTNEAGNPDKPKADDLKNYRTSIEEDIKKSNDLYEQIPDFTSWLEAQKTITYVRWILDKDKDKVSKNKEKLKHAKKPLTDAIEILEKQRLNEVRILGLHRYLAELNLRLGFYPEALTAARKAARYSPYDKEVRGVLGDIYISMKNYSRGIDELETSFNQGNSESKMLIKIGDAHCKNGALLFQPEKQKEAFQEAIKAYSQCLNIMMDKSYNEYSTQEREEENKTAVTYPYNEMTGDVHYNLGTTYIKLSQYDEAVNHFQIALKIEKILGRIKKRLKIQKQMAKLFTKAKIQQFRAKPNE